MQWTLSTGRRWVRQLLLHHPKKTLLHLLKQKAPHVRFREVYGMTEMSPFVTFTRMDTIDTEGSSGQLTPNTSMKVVSVDSGEELGVGETGELCFRGPQVNK